MLLYIKVCRAVPDHCRHITQYEHTIQSSISSTSFTAKYAQETATRAIASVVCMAFWTILARLYPVQENLLGMLC
jgi:hypothetical protein